MKALVVRNKTVTVEERPIPQAGATGVVVRTSAASICAAEVLGVTTGAVPDGLITGHEAVGTVHEIGELVRGFAIGQRVAVAVGTHCGRCVECQRANTGHCRGVEWGGYSSGSTRDGSTSEYFFVPDAEVNLTPIPDSLDDGIAVAVTDALVTGTTSLEVPGLRIGASVAVFGQGHIGLGAVAGARVLGGGLVIAVKARPGNEEVSRQLGADHVFNLEDHDPVAEIVALSAGGVDLAVEASGQTDAFPAAIAAARLGGAVSVLSAYSQSPESYLRIPLDYWGQGLGDKTIYSSMARTGSERTGRLLRLVAKGRIDLSPMMTHRYRFSDVEQAFADVRDRKPGLVKPLITF